MHHLRGKQRKLIERTSRTRIYYISLNFARQIQKLKPDNVRHSFNSIEDSIDATIELT